MYAISHKIIGRNVISAVHVSTGVLDRKPFFVKDKLLSYFISRNRPKNYSQFWQTFTKGLIKLHSLCPVEHFEQMKTSSKNSSPAEKDNFFESVRTSNEKVYAICQKVSARKSFLQSMYPQEH